jgi:hypothetical protein
MLLMAVGGPLAVGIARATAASSAVYPPPRLDMTMLFGFLWTFLTLVCFAHRWLSRRWMLAFAVSLVVLAGYGLVVGSWALAAITLAWSLATFKQWRRGVTLPVRGRGFTPRAAISLRATPMSAESRMTRMFGLN